MHELTTLHVSHCNCCLSACLPFCMFHCPHARLPFIQENRVVCDNQPAATQAFRLDQTWLLMLTAGVRHAMTFPLMLLKIKGYNILQCNLCVTFNSCRNFQTTQQLRFKFKIHTQFNAQRYTSDICNPDQGIRKKYA